MMLFYISSMIFIISGLLLTILLITSMKSLFNRSILSAFECGFDPYNSARIHFSLQFFLIAVIFLIFDIEIVILLPLPLVQGISMPWAYFNIVTVFILLLLLGTYYEWINGALSWVI